MKIKDTVHFQWYKTLFVVVILAICLIGSIRYTNADF